MFLNISSSLTNVHKDLRFTCPNVSNYISKRIVSQRFFTFKTINTTRGKWILVIYSCINYAMFKDYQDIDWSKSQNNSQFISIHIKVPTSLTISMPYCHNIDFLDV